MVISIAREGSEKVTLYPLSFFYLAEKVFSMGISKLVEEGKIDHLIEALDMCRFLLIVS